MPICIKHLQQYNEDGFCIYCGKPTYYQNTTTNLDDTHIYSKEDLDIKSETTTSDQPCRHEWELSGIKTPINLKICKKCGERK